MMPDGTTASRFNTCDDSRRRRRPGSVSSQEYFFYMTAARSASRQRLSPHRRSVLHRCRLQERRRCPLKWSEDISILPCRAAHEGINAESRRRASGNSPISQGSKNGPDECGWPSPDLRLTENTASYIGIPLQAARRYRLVTAPAFKPTSRPVTRLEVGGNEYFETDGSCKVNPPTHRGVLPDNHMRLTGSTRPRRSIPSATVSPTAALRSASAFRRQQRL